MLNERMAVAAFVVIPSENFDQSAINDAGHGKLGDGRIRIADDVRRDERVFGHGENAFPTGICGGCAEDIVDFFGRGFLL